ncbi:ECF RNA polymerase sigma factor SigK [Posidoniimonas polymericola]|uniref:ECF RNA polymerase sigma factor SigK n=2 Tax=Posidoniimonas polymericola TaxID=2528002 RepID=A0A5C5YTV6_9BACT|nr:ECF RNA polymerase sigma factor SigK [Posidoniimonas polymericola]
MSGVCRADRAALAALYDRHAPSIYAVCLRVLRQPADAEAVVSDVFLEIWRKPAGFDPARGTCRSYLLTMARSRSIDRLRSLSTRRTRTAEAQADAEGGRDARQAGLDPAGAAEANERRATVQAVVERLGEDQREVLMLSFFDGLTHKQIAEELGLPLGTVKTRIRSGLKTLRQALVQMGVRDAV